MSFIVLQVLLLFICNSYFCLSQNMEELLFASVREAIGEIKAIGQKVTEMENTMSSKFEDMENTMSSKLEDMENTMSSKLEDMENTISSKFEEMENTTSAKLEEMENTMSSKLEEMEYTMSSKFEEMENTMYSKFEEMENKFEKLERIEHATSSKVSNLQELLATDECAAADSNDCSYHACCQDKMILYQCDCMSGYIGDGFTCCPTDFTDVPGVGCLKAIAEEKNFDDAVSHCSTLSAQLVVPQNFTVLRDYIQSLPGSMKAYWVAIQNRKWLDGRDVAQGEWRSGEPNNDVSACGYFFRDGIQDWSCTRLLQSFCQLK